MGRESASKDMVFNAEVLSTVLASISDGVIGTDTDGRITLINPAAEALTGWSDGTGLGRPVIDLLSPSEDSVFPYLGNPAIQAMQGSEAVEFTARTIKEGRLGRLEGTATAARDAAGTTIGAVLIFRDALARESAGRVQARLAAIVESSDDAILSKTLDGIIQSWNAAAVRVFGWTSDEAVGRPITLIIPPDRLNEEREILARIARGERVHHFETLRLRKSGDLVPISLTVSPVRDPSGRIVGASKVARDISEQRRAEAALRDADQRKDQFIALLAHELRNPLAPLRNGLEVIRLSGDSARGIAETRAMMERQLCHMVRLIDDLLDVSRINQSKMELRRSRVMLSEVLSSAVETARPAFESAGHQFTLSQPSEPVYLDADLTRLAQVFSNLLTNSAKYTPPGGQVWLTVERLGDEVRAIVRDNGIGIPRDAIPHIFDMFSQVDRSIERASGGLGIGLALVKGLVEMHGGTVTAESDGQGHGSVFTVRLPILRPHPEQEAIVALHPAPGPPRRVLVADDNRDSAESMAMMLRAMGHEVDTASDGADAVQRAGTFRPDVILMDIGMPRLNGYDATQQIREQPWGRDMIIIAVTGWGHHTDRAHSQSAGCNGHLVKPVSARQIERLLASSA